MVLEVGNSLHAGAAGTTKDVQAVFHAVADHPGVAAFAVWGKFVNGAFKAIK
jgi:hypothetical protein